MNRCCLVLACLLVAACSNGVATAPPNGTGGVGGTGGATSSTTTSGIATSSGGVVKVCEPGSQQACGCPAGASGVETCFADGSGFGLCAGCTAPDVPWSRSFGSKGDYTLPTSLAVLPDGSVVATWFTYGANPFSYTFRRFDPAGNVVWEEISPLAQVFAVTADADGSSIVTGRVDTEASNFLGAPVDCTDNQGCPFVARLGADGLVSWIRNFEPGPDAHLVVEGASIGPDGRIAITGHYTGTIDLGVGPLPAGEMSSTYHDAFVAVLTTNGETLWSRSVHIEGTNDSFGFGVPSLTGTGELVVSGSTVAPIDFGEGLEPIATDGSLFGRTGFIARYDATGELLFHRLLGSAPDSDAALLSITTDEAGDVWMTGGFRGPFDLGDGVNSGSGTRLHIVAKLGPNGEVLLEEQIAEGYSEFAYFTISRAPNGDLWLCGEAVAGMEFAGQPVESTSSGDLLLLHYDASFHPIDSRRFGSSGSQTCRTLRFDKLSAPVLAGELKGAIDFGQGLLESVGETDLVLAKLAP